MTELTESTPYFRVTYERTTPELYEQGGVESRGFLGVEMRLRQAVKALGYGEQGFEPNEWPGNGFRWITTFEVEKYTRQRMADDSTENRSLHIPDQVTNSSRARILRLVESGNYC